MTTIDVDAKYTLTNPALGASKVVASDLDSDQLKVEASNSGQTQQWWYFTSTNISQVYRIHTVQKGDDQALDLLRNFQGANTLGVHFYYRNDSANSQLWHADNWDDGSFRLSNYVQGPDLRISFNTGDSSFILAEGDHPEQHWSLARVGSLSSVSTQLKPATSTASPSASSTASSAASPSKKGKPPTRTIVGSVVGGTIALVLLIWLVVFLLKRRNRNLRVLAKSPPTTPPPSHPAINLDPAPRHRHPQGPANITADSVIGAHN